MQYTQAEKADRLYNGGDRISEQLLYSLPDDVSHDKHCVARYAMEAPANEFFNLPKMFVIQGSRIYVPFTETVLRSDRYGERGVILVNPDYELPKDPETADKIPIANTDKDAIKKAERHWYVYVSKVAQQWLDECNEVRSRGGVPRAASGFVLRALKLRGIEDPGTQVLTQAINNKTEMEEMKERMKKQDALIEKLLAKAGNESKSASRSS